MCEMARVILLTQYTLSGMHFQSHILRVRPVLTGYASIKAGWLPALVEHIWNTAWALDDVSVPGQIVNSLFGYRNSPALSEVIVYSAYLLTVLVLLWRSNRVSSRTLPEPKGISSS